MYSQKTEFTLWRRRKSFLLNTCWLNSKTFELLEFYLILFFIWNDRPFCDFYHISYYVQRNSVVDVRNIRWEILVFQVNYQVWKLNELHRNHRSLILSLDSHSWFVPKGHVRLGGYLGHAKCGQGLVSLFEVFFGCKTNQ